MFKSSGVDNIWFRNMGTPLGGQGVSAILKSFVDCYETIDGKTIQSLPADERNNFEKDPLHKPRDPRLYATVFLPGDNTTISNYTYEPFNENSSDYVGKTGAVRSGYMMKKIGRPVMVVWIIRFIVMQRCCSTMWNVWLSRATGRIRMWRNISI